MIQCKRKKREGPTEASEEIEKTLSAGRVRRFDPQAYLLICSGSVSADSRDVLTRAAAASQTPVTVEPTWGATTVLSKLLDESATSIFARFIGPLPFETYPPLEGVMGCNEQFVGRESHLGLLKVTLVDSGQAVLIQALAGLGGVGKTQIAVEYCYRQQLRYSGAVFWVVAETVKGLLSEYAARAFDHKLVDRLTAVDDAAAENFSPSARGRCKSRS